MMQAERSGWRTLTTLVLLAVMALELARLYSGRAWTGTGAHVAMLLLVPVAGRLLGLREAYLLSLCGAVTWAVWRWHPDPAGTVDAALDQAAFLMAFILLISLVQEGARTSPAVIACGDYLARQPGSRRFLALYTGANLMTVVFNLGSISLIAPLVRRAAEESAGDPLAPVRERRQLAAMLRGFAWSVVWSPTAVAPLALMGLIPGIDRPRWIALGMALALAMMAVGWAEDRWRWRRFTARARGQAPSPAPPFPGGAFARFAAVCAAFGGLTAAAMALTGQGVPAGLMAASPVLLAGWVAVQQRGAGRVQATTVRLGQVLTESLPLSAPAAVTLACSGYIGRAAGGLIPAPQFAAWIGLEQMPAWLFLISLPVAIAALAQLALSPIMMAVFFGTLLGSLPQLPASPTLTALAISTGWALSMTCSPFASVVILLARMTGQPGARLTWNWNAAFSALAVATLAAGFWVMLRVA